MNDAVEALLETVPDPLWIVSAELEVARANPAFIAACGT